jgi:hypothetical protein
MLITYDNIRFVDDTELKTIERLQFNGMDAGFHYNV